MSRRYVFVIVVTVVMLYFSVILFLLQPMTTRGYISVYHRDLAIRRRILDLHWCKHLKFRSTPLPKPVALASRPGSGNTWLRYLLQQATGIITGSVYLDHSLRMHGFPGENVKNGSVLVVKTHELPPEDNFFSSAVLLIRNPRNALMAEFHRMHKGHIGTAPKTAFKKKNQLNAKSEWEKFVSRNLAVYGKFHELWLRSFPGPVHVLFYEKLVRDTRVTLLRLLDFLHFNITEEDMKCTMMYREGIYRRRVKHAHFDPFTREMHEELERLWNRNLQLVAEYLRRRNHTTDVLSMI